MNNRIASNDIEFIKCEIKARLQKRRIINKYKDSSDEELKEISTYLSKNAITVFPYEFTKKYKISDFHVELDKSNGLFFYVKDGFKIYLRRGYKSGFRASKYMRDVNMEQDPMSPHCYTNEDFLPSEDSILFDIGGAEGIFTVKYLERVKHAYIFECDPRWIEALTYTFKDYKDKVTVVPKYVTNYCDDEHITIDKFIEDNNLTAEKIFIKADVEGDECNIVNGASKILERRKDIKIALCTYHIQDHEALLTGRFKDWKVSTTKGYMLYYYDFDFNDPYVRRGVIRIES
ncbi:MAG: FkbM family methyltransferase [Saccharofermentans sp.]|nr:FkbM family methyltransferase [Saccharofermentans sp.]